MSTHRKIHVGIVGANAERGWARDAHVPALKALAQDFELSAVSARTQDIAEQARVAFGAQQAFADSLALARAPEVELVVVAVKVPEHRAVVLAALQAGKHVMCEWPLGRDVAEADEMAAAVGPASHVMIGLQGLSAPAIRQAMALVREGAIGKPTVMRVFSPTAGWGAQAPPAYAYLQDKRNGATLETITGGHTLAAMEAIIGRYTEIDARSSILRRTLHIQGTDETIERSCADHVMVLGQHESGCVSTLEVAGGTTFKPFMLELEGEAGWLRITGNNPGGYQTGMLVLESSVTSGGTSELITTGLNGPPINVAESYARLAEDIRSNTKTVPDFDAARQLSRLLNRIERASESGRREV
ncbi:oxidoreductase [Acidocella aquatica]|uniref:Oxidoreductase n=1 Tax=Acidocella aquatica TaxID=1922313 RepID=A0ABQ6A3W6_9PROT|nr:Gfo/Idh/MocA family oxidoreductase [Acidocella aquatica]GLR67180.1 oxidoreductase [Acidocella aquatica]